MKIILYMAISADGFIATEDGNTDWVGAASWNSYKEFVRSCDAVLVGGKTYKIMEEDEFAEGTEYFVVTESKELDTGDYKKISINSVEDLPSAAVIGIIGGGDTNGRLAKLGVIDEVILDIEPVIFGTGINLLGNHAVDMKLELLESKKLGENGIQNRYEVVK